MTYLWIRSGPLPRGSDGHLGTFWARPASEPLQNHPDTHVRHPQNTDLDALNPTILLIWRETAGKAGIILGFHPTKLSVGPTTPRAGIIIPHNPQGGVGEYFSQHWKSAEVQSGRTLRGSDGTMVGRKANRPTIVPSDLRPVPVCFEK